MSGDLCSTVFCRSVLYTSISCPCVQYCEESSSGKHVSRTVMSEVCCVLVFDDEHSVVFVHLQFVPVPCHNDQHTRTRMGRGESS